MTAPIPLKITAIGDLRGVVLPKAVLDRLQIGEDETLYLLETPRGFELTARDPEFAVQMEIAEAIMREDHDALSELAK